MTSASISGAAARQRRDAQASLYQPRSRAVRAASPPLEDPRLTRLTREALEALKHPTAVPSRVIMHALKQAAALGRG